MTCLSTLSIGLRNMSWGRTESDEDLHGTQSRAREILASKRDSEVELQTRRHQMTLAELHKAVLKLLPDDCRVDVSLVVRRHAPVTYLPERQRLEVSVAIDVWYRGMFEDVEAPTCEAAFEKFRVVLLPELGLATVAPAAERLAAMDVAFFEALK